MSPRSNGIHCELTSGKSLRHPFPKLKLSKRALMIHSFLRTLLKNNSTDDNVLPLSFDFSI